MNTLATKTTREERVIRDCKIITLRTVNCNDSILYSTDIEYNEKNKVKEIIVRDYTDSYNEPVMFSLSIRWLNKVENAILNTDIVTWRIVNDLFSEHNIKIHRYCARD